MFKFISLAFVAVAAHGKMFLVPGENLEDCTSGGKAKYVDWTGLTYDAINDTLFYMNGELRFLQAVKSPWRLRMYMEKFERNAWNIAVMDRKVPDFCLIFNNPLEPTYIFTSKLKKGCPFPAGHVEKIENLKLGEVPEGFPRTMAGQYRAVLISDFMEGLKTTTECLRVNMDFYYEE